MKISWMKKIPKISLLLLTVGSCVYGLHRLEPVASHETVVSLKPGDIYTVGTVAPNFSINNPQQIVSYNISYEDGQAIPATQAFLKMVKKTTDKASVPGAVQATYTYTLYINPEACSDAFIISQKDAQGTISTYKEVSLSGACEKK